jgi:hypothetical protein
VVDDADPLQQGRLLVVVPEVYGDAPAWAAASFPARAGVGLPTVGDLLWVSFRHGDTDEPVWQTEQPTEDGPVPAGGFVGTYRGVVVAADDPLEQHRLQVTVPELGAEPSWATPTGDVDDGEAPAVGDEVWIRYELGDPAHPQWVGRA